MPGFFREENGSDPQRLACHAECRSTPNAPEGKGGKVGGSEGVGGPCSAFVPIAEQNQEKNAGITQKTVVSGFRLIPSTAILTFFCDLFSLPPLRGIYRTTACFPPNGQHFILTGPGMPDPPTICRSASVPHRGHAGTLRRPREQTRLGGVFSFLGHFPLVVIQAAGVRTQWASNQSSRSYSGSFAVGFIRTVDIPPFLFRLLLLDRK
jgi:hypothetical protein